MADDLTRAESPRADPVDRVLSWHERRDHVMKPADEPAQRPDAVLVQQRRRQMQRSRLALNVREHLPAPMVESDARGAPSKPACSRCLSSSWIASVHGPASRCTLP